MPAIATEDNRSTGHECYPPTLPVGPYSTKTRINGKFVQLKNVTQYRPHTCNRTTHAGMQRLVTGGSSTVRIEGYDAVRIGDQIACGDIVGIGSRNTFGGD